MQFYVYILQSVGSKRSKSYVGYTKDLKKRIFLHNQGKAAKATRGYKWKIVFKRKFFSKSKAMSFEYKLKKDRLKRNILINAYKKKQN